MIQRRAGFDPERGTGMAILSALVVVMAGLVITTPAMSQNLSDTDCVKKQVRIDGNSMAPALEAGSMHTGIFGDKDCIGPLKRGAVVLFDSAASDLPLIKWVIATPGDQFAVQDQPCLKVEGKCATNSRGQAYRPRGSRSKMIGLYEESYDSHVPEGAYLLMGEATDGSKDSSRFGLIGRKQIIGRLVEKKAGSGTTEQQATSTQ